MEASAIAGLLVSASTGVVNSVIEKLTALMGEEYEKHKSVQREAAFLKEELGSINALLMKLGNMEELDPQAKEWRDQVMDTAFDIEDFIDGFMHQAGEAVNTGDVGFIHKIAQFVNAIRVHYKFANQIQDLKTQLKEANERRKRYKVDECTSISSCMAIDSRIAALYTEAENLVGIDGPKNDIMKLLIDEKASSMPCLRVVSVVGFGGLGKTTLANEVYRNLGRTFEYKAFVSVSQKPDLMKFFGKIMSKLNIPLPYHNHDEQDLINGIREYLLGKRYLFVIDDLWDESAWEIIRCAFPNNHHGSILITTTRIETVAIACCTHNDEYIYKIKPLDDHHSRKLFLSRIGYVNSQQFKEVSDEILHKCGGLPLAIISIASLLASQPSRRTEQWQYLCSCLRFDLKTNPTLAGLRQVLKLSYNNLPRHLKPCLLYIGICPEDYSFKKHDLVRKWVAEGFVSTICNRDAEDISESYFNDLVNRSMIQPAEIDSLSGEVLLYKVHDMIHGLIASMAEEEKFFKVIDNLKCMNKILQYKVRRLSLQLGDTNEDTVLQKLSLSHVRSLSSFQKSHFFLPISEFKSLRVLCVEHWSYDSNDVVDLTQLVRLYQLRYLKIIFNGVIQLPTQISGLKLLETLEIDGKVTDFPSDIFHLPCLLHLFVPATTKLPDGIGKMKSLRSLSAFNLSMNSLHNLKGLAELTNLRDLDLCGYTDGIVGHMDVFWSSIGTLLCGNLRSLQFETFLSGIVPADELSSQTISPSHLERLQAVNWQFPRLPKWTDKLHKLSILHIGVTELMEDDIGTLAALPELSYLWLWTKKGPKQRIIIPCMAFPVLKCLIFSCFELCLSFEAGAMPKLHSLRLGFHAQGVGLYGPTLDGIEKLQCLEEVVAYIYCGGNAESYRMGAEAALRSAVSIHHGQPFVAIFNADEYECGLDQVFKDDSTDQADNKSIER